MAAPLGKADLEWSIGERFAAVAAAFASKIAIRTPRDAITYGHLKARADAIAGHVIAHAKRRPELRPYPVVTFLPQGIDAIAAQLGILGAGACYVALDVRNGGARLSDVARHAGTALVIAGRESVPFARTAVGSDADVADIEDISDEAVHCTRDPSLPPVSPAALAYIYYTSGSTGIPKGVADTHRNVVHNVLRYTRSLGIGPDDRLTLLQPPSFSGAVSSTYGALLNGATLLPFDLHVDGPHRLAAWLAENAVTIYHSVPAIFRSCVAGCDGYPALRYVRLEGDRALARDAELFQAHFGPGCRLVNGLGATETGLVRQFFVTHDAPIGDGPLPLGYPVDDVECIVVDPAGNRVANGQIGEIIVQSAYLAEGYWRDAALTAMKFDRAAGSAGTRRYRTGDLGRMRADGCLEYHGRSGTQVKIHGASLDLADIEQALVRVPGVRDAAVAKVENAAGNATLVAVVAAGATGAVMPAKLRMALDKALSGQVVPTRFVLREALPLTSVGKIDRAAIARIVDEAPAGPAARVPGPALTSMEEGIARIWKAVLDDAVIRPNVPFLECGGDSLLAMQILLRLHRDLGVLMSPAEFFAASTVAGQARFAEAALCAGDTAEAVDDGRVRGRRS